MRERYKKMGYFCSAPAVVCGRRFIGGVCVVVVGVAVCSASWQPPSGWRGWWRGRTNRPRQMFFTGALFSLVKLYWGSAKSHLHVSAVVMMAFYCGTDSYSQAVLFSYLSHLHVSASVLVEVWTPLLSYSDWWLKCNWTYQIPVRLCVVLMFFKTIFIFFKGLFISR